MDPSEANNSIEEYNRFLNNICEKFKDEGEADDSVTFRLNNLRITPCELEGECLEWCLDFLSTNGCHPGLSACLAHEVYKRIASENLDEFYTDDTKNIGLKTDSDGDERKNDNHTMEEIERGNNLDDEDTIIDQHDIIEYNAETLHIHVIATLESVCHAWLTNFPDVIIQKKLLEVNFHAIKNSRRKMEDKHIIVHDLNALFGIKDQPQQSYYGVFDGHAGTDAALFTAKNLHCNLVHNCSLDQNPVEACKAAFKVTDEQFIAKAKREHWRSGTTAITALVRGNKLYLAWLGDAQTVLIKNGNVVTHMEPHKPDRQDERDRIEGLGGIVVQTADLWRVGGNLAVSRAIGDVAYKPFVSSDAEVLEISLDGTEDYMVLGCDGLWDGMQPQDIPRIIYNYLLESNFDRAGTAKYLVRLAKDNGSQDNISVIVVFFREIIAEPAESGGLFKFLADESQGSNHSEDGEFDEKTRSGNPGNNANGNDNISGVLQKDNRGGNADSAVTEPSFKGDYVTNTIMNIDLVGHEQGEATLSKLNILMNINNDLSLGANLSQMDLDPSLTLNPDPKEEDLNTRLFNQLDTSLTEDPNSTSLLKIVSNSVFNDQSFCMNPLLGKPVVVSNKFEDSYIKSNPKRVQKKSKKSDLMEHVPQKIRSKNIGNSPVCWAFTGKNKASVQNHRLNLAAKIQNKGSGPSTGDHKLVVKPAQNFCENSSKIAQKLLPSENIFEIAKMTNSRVKLEKLSPPRSKAEPLVLQAHAGFTVFGSKASLQAESQKIHATWQPRKPLKPIPIVMSESPPSPFFP